MRENWRNPGLVPGERRARQSATALANQFSAPYNLAMADQVQQDFDIVVAGGGIAGLTAGLTAARLGRSTLILMGDLLGGHLLSIEKIEGYPGFPDGVAGYELCPGLQMDAAAAGASIEMENVQKLSHADDLWSVTTAERTIGAAAVIVATGSSLRTLGVPGETEFVGKGVSHCASCDAPLLRDQAVAVVGGGDSALQEALTLADTVGAVTVLQRGPTLTGQESFRSRVEAHENIQVRFDCTVAEICGDQAVTGIKIQTGDGTDDKEVPVGGVFIYVGQQPNSAYLEDVLSLEESGHIKTDAAMRTELPGLLAAGSVRKGAPGRAVASAGDGTAAAIAADHYLTDGIWT